MIVLIIRIFIEVYMFVGGRLVCPNRGTAGDGSSTQ